MLAPVSVLSEADFNAWVEENSISVADLNAVERGKLWASSFGCVGCHSVDGQEMVGPTWLDLYGKEEMLEDGTTVVVDDTYIFESIANPGAKITAGFQNIMPPNLIEQIEAEENELLEQRGIEVDIPADIADYIESLSQ
jgi:cytochrome c oxidase subunit 2